MSANVRLHHFPFQVKLHGNLTDEQSIILGLFDDHLIIFFHLDHRTVFASL